MEPGTSRPSREISVAELEAWLLLGRLPGIGDQKISILVQRLGTPEAVVQAPPEQLAAILTMEPAILKKSLAAARNPHLSRQIEALRNGDFRLYTLWDADYPEPLRNIYTPPVVLFSRSPILHDDARSVAIVGSRAATEYGKRVAYDLAFGLATAGFTVVSGLARGIDSLAHKGALDAGGRTIAVLGCGPDLAYPPENRALMESIVAQGAVISEFPPGTTPSPRHFPRRNRVIAGLSLGVVVVQAGQRSGALITAGRALEQGKEVMAVPGPINARISKGPHNLIKQGAALVEDVDDILVTLGEPLSGYEKEPRRAAIPKLDAEESAMIRLLGFEPMHIDELCARTGESTGILLARLLQLELKGAVKQLAGKQFLSLIDLGSAD